MESIYASEEKEHSIGNSTKELLWSNQQVIRVEMGIRKVREEDPGEQGKGPEGDISGSGEEASRRAHKG